MIQIGGIYTTEGILEQKYGDKNGRCMAILLKALGSGVDLSLLNSVVLQASPITLREPALDSYNCSFSHHRMDVSKKR